MAVIKKKWEKFRKTLPGEVLLALLYALMLAAALICMSSDGGFIYEL